MAVDQFQYPHAGSLIFGKTACVCELIWKKRCVSERLTPPTIKKRHVSPPSSSTKGVFHFSREKTCFLAFFDLFFLYKLQGPPLKFVLEKTPKNTFFRQKRKTAHAGGGRWTKVVFFDCRWREAFQKAPFFKMS